MLNFVNLLFSIGGIEILPAYVIAFFSIILLECILSVDNAAVIATVANNPKLTLPQQRSVTKWGIAGALVLRGLLILGVGWLVANPTVTAIAKLIGGAYLIWLGYKALFLESPEEEEEVPGWLDRTIKALGVSVFIGTIIEVEIVDLIFSIDNVFACVAFTENLREPVSIWGYQTNVGLVISILAVFVGIITMRFVITLFQKALRKYPELNECAFIVIMLLGIKLFIGGIFTFTFVPFHTEVNHVLENHWFDLTFSGVMLVIFFYPFIKSWFVKKPVLGDGN